MRRNRSHFGINTPIIIPILAVSLLTSAKGHAQAINACEASAHRSDLDWVPYSELSPIQQATLGKGCCGAYVVPESYTLQIENVDDLEEIYAGSDSSRLEDEGNTSVLEGNVFVQLGYRRLTADEARIDQTGDNATLTGNVTFRDPGMLLVGNEASITLSDRSGSIKDSEFVIHETGLRGSAELISIQQAKSIHLNNGGVTSCSPGDASWYLQSGDIVIDTESGLGTVKNAKLEIASVPILYIPWAQFPIDDRRMTGLLFPSIGAGSDGFDFSVPVYINLATNYDATLTPRYIAERGFGLEAEGRLLTANQESTFSGGYWNHDDKADLTRWLVGVQHTGGQDKAWFTSINYTEVSDIDYFRDLDTYGLDVSAEDNLTQRAEAGYQTDYIHLGVRLNQYQALSVTTQNLYRELPKVWVDFDYPFMDGLHVSGGAETTTFKSYDALDIDEGQRSAANVQLAWDQYWAPGYASFGARVDTLTYDIDRASSNLSTSASPNATISRYWLGGGLFFERFDNNSDSAIVLEPEAFYVYAPYVDQSTQPLFDTTSPYQNYRSLYDERRFTGGDRYGDDNRLTTGIRARFIDNSSGDEWLTIGISQAFYFDTRYVAINERLTPEIIDNPTLLADPTDSELLELKELTRDQSDLIIESTFDISQIWAFSTELNWDTIDDQVNRSATYLQYSEFTSALVNLGLIYQRQGETPDSITGMLTDRDTFQTLVSAYIPVTDSGWSVFGRWAYDMTYSNSLDFLAGIEYDTCCWRIALGYQVWVDSGTASEIRELDDKTAIRFQFELKGLGSGQSAVDRLLGSISGYEDYEKNN